MTDFGNWIKRLQSWRVGLGIAILAATAVFSLGAATMGTINTMSTMPKRLDTVESKVDTLVATLGQHIERDSVTTNRIFCVVRALADDPGAPINPLDPCRRN